MSGVSGPRVEAEGEAPPQPIQERTAVGDSGLRDCGWARCRCFPAACWPSTCVRRLPPWRRRARRRHRRPGQLDGLPKRRHRGGPAAATPTPDGAPQSDQGGHCVWAGLLDALASASMTPSAARPSAGAMSTRPVRLMRAAVATPDTTPARPHPPHWIDRAAVQASAWRATPAVQGRVGGGVGGLAGRAQDSGGGGEGWRAGAPPAAAASNPGALERGGGGQLGGVAGTWVGRGLGRQPASARTPPDEDQAGNAGAHRRPGSGSRPPQPCRRRPRCLGTGPRSRTRGTGLVPLQGPAGGRHPAPRTMRAAPAVPASQRRRGRPRSRPPVMTHRGRPPTARHPPPGPAPAPPSDRGRVGHGPHGRPGAGQGVGSGGQGTAGSRFVPAHDPG